MATIEQKETLVETLKFTPTTVRLSMWGYGGEIAVAKINKEQYDYWSANKEETGSDAELVDHCVSWNDEENENPVPESARIVEDANWYDTEGHIDNMSGVEFSDSNHIVVTDENGDEIFNETLSWELEDKHGVQLEGNEIMAADHDDVEYAFCFQSMEKGTFFDGDIELTAPFDPSKLKIYTTDFEGWELVSGVEYNGEPVEGFDGYDTTGKGYYANVFEV